jgi:hypothetical protein
MNTNKRRLVGLAVVWVIGLLATVLTDSFYLGMAIVGMGTLAVMRPCDQCNRDHAE